MVKSLMRSWRLAGAAIAVVWMAGPAEAQSPMHLSLGDAVRRAAAETAPVALAGLSVDEAEARVREASSALLPRVQATTATLNRTFNIDAFGIRIPSEEGAVHDPLAGPFANFDARVHFSQPIFDASSVLRRRTARAAVAGSDAQLEMAVEQASERAALAYLRVSHAEAKLAAREADAALAQELLTLAEDQLEAGVSAGIDVIRARTQKAAADGQVLLARNEVDQAAIDLARAIGVAPGTRFELEGELGGAFSGSASLPLDPDAAVTVALSRRPELRQADAFRRTADTAKRAIRAERLPRVELVADYGASGLHPGDAIATRQVGVQVSVPVFDGLGREARLAAQTSVAQESEIRAADLREQISAEVLGALLKRGNGLEREEVAREQLALAEEELAQARERFTSGVAGNIELIDAQAALLRARDALLDAQLATATAAANLARATGTAAEIR